MNQRQTKRAWSLVNVVSTGGRIVKRHRLEFWSERVRRSWMQSKTWPGIDPPRRPVRCECGGE